MIDRPRLLVDIGKHSRTTIDATDQHVLEWLKARSQDADSPWRYWPPIEEYPDQHHFMFEPALGVSDE